MNHYLNFMGRNNGKFGVEQVTCKAFKGCNSESWVTGPDPSVFRLNGRGMNVTPGIGTPQFHTPLSSTHQFHTIFNKIRVSVRVRARVSVKVMVRGTLF